MRHPRALFAAVATLAAVSSMSTVPASAQTDPLAAPITWENCPQQVTEPAAECGRIDVPLEYSDPSGPTISVGFVQVPAAGEVRGTLFGNPGGPGGDGYSYFGSTDLMDWPEAMTSEWNRVAVQPRGLIGSTPLMCDPAALDDPVRGQLSSGAVVRESCDSVMPGYAASITTSNTAEDWEMVRRSLGIRKISIMGTSYGTFLGSLYATRYPGHTDRVVLDSAMDPDLAWNGVFATQQAGYERALHNYFAWVAERNERYGLGETPLAVYQAWSRKVVAESGTNPTVVPPPAQVGDIPPGLEWAGQSAADILTATGKTRVETEGVISRAQNPGAAQINSPTLVMTRTLLPSPAAWDVLTTMINGTAEENLAGGDFSEEDQATQLEALMNFQYMQNSILCNENTVPANYADLPAYFWSAFASIDPFTMINAVYSSGLACSGLAPNSRVELIDGSRLNIRPLQVQGTDDPQTPYQFAGHIHERMGTQLVTVNGPGHGHVGMGNKAVDDIVVQYLRTGVAPATEAPGLSPN